MTLERLLQKLSYRPRAMGPFCDGMKMKPVQPKMGVRVPEIVGRPERNIGREPLDSGGKTKNARSQVQKEPDCRANGWEDIPWAREMEFSARSHLEMAGLRDQEAVGNKNNQNYCGLVPPNFIGEGLIASISYFIVLKQPALGPCCQNGGNTPTRCQPRTADLFSLASRPSCYSSQT